MDNNKIEEHDDQQLKRVLWKCRRGMLELDIMLERFVASGYRQLSADEQQNFTALLEENDTDLFAWLLGHQMPPDDFQNIITKIRLSQHV